MAKSVIKEDAHMKFYDEAKPLYIETDASQVGWGAALLQTRSGPSCPRDEILDNSILRPIAFRRKSLSSIEKSAATKKEKHGVYYMASKTSSITALQER